MINLLDDFHNILTVRQPSNLKLSIAKHMTSSLLDIHPTVPAINLPSSRNQHSSVSVKLPNGDTKTCRGGIVAAHIHLLLRENQKKINFPFMETLEKQQYQISSRDVQNQLKELR